MTKRQLRWHRAAAMLGAATLLALMALSQAPTESLAQDGPQIRVEKTARPSEVPASGSWVTYQIKVRNEGSEAVTLVKLVDNLYGDVTSSGNPRITSSTCSLEAIQPGDTYRCSFEAQAVGNPGSTVTDTVTARVKDARNNKAEASHHASVTIRGENGGNGPKIAVAKSAHPTEVKEPGGVVTYQVKVRNEGAEAVTVVKMHDNLYGDLIVGANSLVHRTTCDLVTIQPGDTYKCDYDAQASGKAGSTVSNTVTVRVKDGADKKTEANAHAAVTITGGHTPVLKIRVEKTANPKEVKEPGGTVTYQVKVRNEGTEKVTLTKMHDSVYGDLSAGTYVDYTTCKLETIKPGTTYTCEFDGEVAGTAGHTVSDTVTVRAKDAAGNKVEASGKATVAITGESKPTLKIRVEKTAHPSQVLEPGQLVTYRVKVRNEGSEVVTIVKMHDNVYGDLISGTYVDYTSCVLETLSPGSTYQCEFDGEVLGYAGTKVTDVVTVRVKDPSGNKVEASDDATVKIVSEVPDTGVPLPPPVIAGGLMALGAAAMGAGAWVQSRGRKAK